VVLVGVVRVGGTATALAVLTEDAQEPFNITVLILHVASKEAVPDTRETIEALAELALRVELTPVRELYDYR